MKVWKVDQELQVFICSDSLYSRLNLNGGLEDSWELTYVRIHCQHFLRRRNFRELFHRYQRQTGLKGKKMLAAHGGSDKGVFSYQDRGKIRSIQSWIEKHDGTATALLLSCCNERNLDITAKHSLVLHPNQDFSGMKLWGRKGIIRLYVPGYGYVDDNYHQMRKALGELQ